MVKALFPDEIGAGLTFERLITQTAYPAPAWSIMIALRGPQVIDLTSTPQGTQHKIKRTATDTANWLPGAYAYAIRATDGVDVVEIERGTVKILADLATAGAGHDSSTHASRTLAAIEAVIENRASIDQERYRINNRELYRTPIAELLKLRDTYRAEVQRERAAARGSSLFGATVRVRLQ